MDAVIIDANDIVVIMLRVHMPALVAIFISWKPSDLDQTLS